MHPATKKAKLTDIVSPDTMKRLAAAGYMVVDVESVLEITSCAKYDPNVLMGGGPEAASNAITHMNHALVRNVLSSIPETAFTRNDTSGPWGVSTAITLRIFTGYPKGRVSIN